MDRPSPAPGWPRPEGGGIVLGWLVRLTVVLAVVGVVAVDGLSVFVSEMGARDVAAQAARAASREYMQTHDAGSVYAAASEVLATENASLTPDSLRLAADGTVTLEVTRRAPTLLLYRFPRTARLAVVTADGRGRATP